MSTKAIVKLIYISGMGLLGESVGNLLASIGGKKEVARLLMRVSGAATGAYAGLIIANDIDDIVGVVIDQIKHNEDDNMEVYDE